MNLSLYDNSSFKRGVPRWKEALWLVVSMVFFRSWIPWPSSLRTRFLVSFGAKIGSGVRIHTGVNISFPWRLEIGDHVWLGEDVRILSLAWVKIGSNVCISQQAYLCTGSHDHRKETFDLITAPICIEQGSWIASRAFIGAGVTVGAGSIVGAGAVVIRDVPSGMAAYGNPVVLRKIDR